MSTRLIAGTMTGTSIDSLDAALVSVEGTGLEMRASLVRGVTLPLDGVRGGLRLLAEQRPMTAGEIAGIAHEFALLHVRALKELIGGDRVDLVCVHGQTVFHAPPLSWQLMQPAPVARAMGVPVVFDLRAADLAAGGQGAPVTPLADWVLYSGAEPVDIVNLGGFCNITHLPARGGGGSIGGIGGADVCVCNQLLDSIARAMLDTPMDPGGAAASRGSADAAALRELNGLLDQQGRSGRSLGTGDELGAWMGRHRRTMRAEDLLATACEAVAGRIASRARAPLTILAGGGVRNRALTATIGARSTGKVVSSDAVGIPCEYREAACFAVLGALCRDGMPITLPGVTGVPAPAPLSGCWAFPGGLP